MVATEACKLATCDSRATATRSRKRRWVRSLITRRNQVAATELPSPIPAPIARLRLPWSTPSASNFIHNASNASGNAASNARPKETASSRGSDSCARFNARHMGGRDGGSVLAQSLVEVNFILSFLQTRSLKFEHRVVAALGCHQFVMRA